MEEGTVGNFYSHSFEASGGEGSLQFTWATGFSAPPGLTLGLTTGILSGTCTTAGTFPIRIQVFDQCVPFQQAFILTDLVVLEE